MPVWPGREARKGLLCSGRHWLCVAGSGAVRDNTKNEEPGGPPRGLPSTCGLPGKGFEQESDAVRFYWFLLFNASLAAVWRMAGRETKGRRPAKSYCNGPGKS